MNGAGAPAGLTDRVTVPRVTAPRVTVPRVTTQVEAAPRGSRRLTWVLVTLWIGVAGPLTLAGLSYYLTPVSERPYSPAHTVFAPTGVVGHSLGIVGSMMMAGGVAMYALRKRWGRLARAGKLSTWLQTHIFLCTLGPFLVLLHTTFKFGGIVSIAFWSMAIVVISGVFGRYIYVRIPKTVQGRFRTLKEVRDRADSLLDEAVGATSVRREELERALNPAVVRESRGLLPAVVQAVRFDVGARVRTRRIRRLLTVRGVRRELREPLVALLRERARLEQQMLLLTPFQRMFRYWHTIHLPLTIVMFVILAIHVAVAIAFGYGWPF